MKTSSFQCRNECPGREVLIPVRLLMNHDIDTRRIPSGVGEVGILVGLNGGFCMPR